MNLEPHEPILPDKVAYGLMVVRNGKTEGLAKLYRSSNEGSDFCGPETCRLSLDSWCSGETFLVDDLEAIRKTLFEDTPWFNSDPRSPGWGDFEREELIPVCVTTKVSPVGDLHIPVDLGKFVEDTRDATVGVASRYAGEKLIFEGRPTLVWVKQRDPFTPYVGKEVCFGSWWNRRKIVVVLPLPEEYVDTLPPEGGLVICDTPK